MKMEVRIPINGSKEDIWKVITDIENATSNISGIEKVEILDHPKDSLVGLKWIETRTMFGKTATETMWVTEAEDNHYYQTRAENHGAIYISRLEISEENGQNFLSMSFDGQAQSFGARIMSAIFGFLMKGATKKMIQQDLEDIKKVVESG